MCGVGHSAFFKQWLGPTPAACDPGHPFKNVTRLKCWPSYGDGFVRDLPSRH
jgi:hypothetical protein